MQIDFHYYATYCAAYLAGFSHEESLAVSYSAQFTDCCTKTLLSRIKAPNNAATSQLQLELLDERTDTIGLQEITRIWASFHFLPRDLKADVQWGSRRYKDKYRMICGPNSDLLVSTVNLAKGKSLQATGLAMHVLADTWAHQYFAGTPSLVINNTDYWFYELVPEGEGFTERQVAFRHNPSMKDNLEKGVYVNTIFQIDENSVMSLGHGRAGHLPDYSFMRYKYLPAWNRYGEIVKDNPSDYYHAFCQMVYAMRFLRGEVETFEKERYDTVTVQPYEEEIRQILTKRQLDSCADWKALGERLSGAVIPDFDIELYQEEYLAAAPEDKENTFLGRYISAALAQKSMVTHEIYRSGSLLAGYSIEQPGEGIQVIRDYAKMIDAAQEMQKNGRADGAEASDGTNAHAGDDDLQKGGR